MASPSSTSAPPSGARVVIRDEEWLVRRTESVKPSGHAVHVAGLSELVRGSEAVFLTALDKIEVLDPERTEIVVDPSPQYRNSRLYLESLLRRTPPPSGDDGIHLGHLAAIRPANYQLEPAAQALRQLRPRILLADGVGLGKTIEVGILLSELIERGRADRILVVALKSVLPQFQQELWARFTIPLVRLDSVGIQRVQSRIPSNMNPFHYYDRAIISIDTLKKDAKYRSYLEQTHWDAIVIDECQNVAARTRGGSTQKSQRARLANLLARTTDALILASATPHDGSAESFASLMNLLDETAIADVDNHSHEDVSHLLVRRFKKDIAHEVDGAFRERQLEPRQIDASPEEDRVFEALRTATFRTVTTGRNARGVLFRTLLLKSFLSSPAACRSTINERIQRLEKLESDTSPSTKNPEDVQHDRVALDELGFLVDRVDADSFSKYQNLLTELKALGFGRPKAAPRIVLFSERIDTLKFLREQLHADLKLVPGRHTALFFGAMTDVEQAEVVREFSTERTTQRILLASDAASEGLNLHYFCHRLIHFDLPWSLITLEQRNGRIDRYGQTEDPLLTYLLTKPTVEEARGDLRILDRLIEKENQAHENLGDAALLMNLHDAEEEEATVARAIEAGTPADQVVPDKPPADGDYLSDLIGDPADTPPARTTRRPTLYPDDPTKTGSGDLQYCLEALDALLNDEDQNLYESLEHADGVLLRSPDDLEHRLRYLPPELQSEKEGSRATFQLTIDRNRVMDSLDAAREHAGGWPEWQLLWEQHPICEWLDDSVAAHFDRHEAPLLRVSHGLAPDHVVFICQGQITNKRGQPAIVEWFGIRFDHNRFIDIQTLDELIEATDLSRPRANPGTELGDSVRAWLEGLRAPAIEQARLHMVGLRNDRASRIRTEVRDGIQRIKRWYDRRTSRLQEAQAAAEARGRSPSKAQQARHALEQREINQVYKKHEEWVTGLQTNDQAHVRLAAILIQTE